MNMRFEVRPLQGRMDHESPSTEYAVFAVEPKAGNDAGLIAIFESKVAADSLAETFNAILTLVDLHT